MSQYSQPSSQSSVYKRLRTYKVRSLKLRKKKTLVTPVVKARRSVQQHMAYNPSSGFAGGGFDLGVAFSLGNMELTIGGVTTYTPSLPSVSEFTNLFDEYRLKSVDLEIYYSQGSSNTVTYPTPMLHIANDDNSAGSFNLADMQQYPYGHTYQLSQAGIKGPIKWRVTPSCRLDALTTTGLTSTSALDANDWIDTSSSNVRFLGTRLWIDNLGRSVDIDMGTITVKATYNLEFRKMR